MARGRSKPATGETGDGEAGILVEHCLPIQDEIWRIVLNAGRLQTPLSLAEQSRKIAAMFPSAKLTPAQVADALVFAAVDAGVAFQTRALPKRQVPTIELPGRFFRLSGKRKQRAADRPNFATDPYSVTT